LPQQPRYPRRISAERLQGGDLNMSGYGQESWCDAMQVCLNGPQITEVQKASRSIGRNFATSAGRKRLTLVTQNSSAIVSCMQENTEVNARRYQLLKNWLLQNNIVQLHKMSRDETEAFVLDTHFYGESFDDVVDSLARENDLRDTSSPH
jgi:hypothetical protein